MTKLQQRQQDFTVPHLVARQSPGGAHAGIGRPRGKKKKRKKRERKKRERKKRERKRKRKKKGRWGPYCLPELGCLATYYRPVRRVSICL
jgi:hypothetical protein